MIIADDGFFFGIGAFETIAVKDGVPTVSYTHLDVYKRQALDCAGTRRVMVNSAKIRLFPGNLNFAITYPPIANITREAAVDTTQISAELIKYWTKLYFSKIYTNASNLILVGSEKGLDKI